MCREADGFLPMNCKGFHVGLRLAPLSAWNGQNCPVPSVHTNCRKRYGLRLIHLAPRNCGWTLTGISRNLRSPQRWTQGRKIEHDCYDDLLSRAYASRRNRSTEIRLTEPRTPWRPAHVACRWQGNTADWLLAWEIRRGRRGFPARASIFLRSDRRS